MNIVPSPAQNALGTITSMIIAAGETVAEALAMLNNGVVFNLTGYTAKMRIAYAGTNGVAAPIDLTTANSGITIPTPSNGTLIINIASTVTAALVPGSYPYDLWIENAAGAPMQLMAGNFVVQASVTPLP